MPLPSAFLFHAPLDRSVLPTVGKGPVESRGIKLVKADGRQVLFVGKGAVLSYPVSENLDKRRGTICMWVRPAWEGDDGKSYAFLSDYIPFPDIGKKLPLPLEVERGLLRFDVRDPGDHYLTFDVRGWRAEEWHHTAAS